MPDTNQPSDTRAAARACARVVGIAAGCILLSLSGPLAATAQHSGESWNDDHMQSNSARRFEPSPPRAPIQGTNRFEQSASNPTAAPPTTVPETTLRLSPHGWAPGGPAGGGASGARASSSRSPGFGGIRGGAAAQARSGIGRGSSGGRSSSLRSTASRNERGSRR